MLYLEDLKSQETIKGAKKAIYKPLENNSFDIEAFDFELDVDSYGLLVSFYSFEYNNNGIVDFGECIDNFYSTIDAINDRDFIRPLRTLIENGFIELYKDEEYSKTDLASYRFEVFYPIENFKNIDSKENKLNIKNTDISDIGYDIVNIERLEEVKHIENVNDLIDTNIRKMLMAYDILNKYTFKEMTLKGFKNLGFEKIGQISYNFDDKMDIIIDGNIYLSFEDLISEPYTYIQHLFPLIYSEIKVKDSFLTLKFEEDVWNGVSVPRVIIEIQ